MPKVIIQGTDANIVARVFTSNGKDPFDFTDVELIRACFMNEDLTSTYVFHVAEITGDTTSGSDIVSNISDLTNLREGQEISGAGIPLNSTILKTPTSTTSPSAAGTVKISANATATATAIALVSQNIFIIGLGKLRLALSEAQTQVLQLTENADNPAGSNFEIMIVKNGYTSVVQYPLALKIVARYC